ncbi:MAG: RNase P modulator RnpM [Halanaerobiales bacterium]
MQGRVPFRKCIACGERKSKIEMIRIVNNKGKILIDPDGKLPGRGAYICPDPVCVENAIKNNEIKKALKTDIPEEIYEQLTEEIGNG